jgi:hypothetical protein
VSVVTELAELVDRINALPSATLLSYLAALRREGLSVSTLTPDTIPLAASLLPEGAETAKTAETDHGASGDERWPEATVRHGERDDSPEAWADRVAAGVATIRLTQEIAAEIGAPRPGWPDLRPSNFYSPDSGPRIPATVSPDWFVPGSEARMSEVERERWFAAWLTYGRTCAARWEWEAERSGRRTVRVLADADSQAF